MRTLALGSLACFTLPTEKDSSCGYNTEMLKRPKKHRKKPRSEEGVWIAPKYSLKGPAGERAWENRPGGAPSSSRYLELADISLGLKKPGPKNRQLGDSIGAHVISNKTEPYSS